MIEILILLCLIVSAFLLILLVVADFKTYLLPNIYVFPFAILGIVFHFSTDFDMLSLSEVLIGGAFGYGILYAIRFAGNKYYGQDSLGLGDVKLLGAAGLWLGLEGVLIAMTAGAFFGLIHGLLFATLISVKNNAKFSITQLKIPAGPGFIAGIILSFIWLYHDFLLRLFYTLTS